MRSWRLLFALAALYNALFGAWAGLFPRSFFTLFSLPPSSALGLAIWSCLGMVVGVYAILYLRASLRPEEEASRWIVAVGLLGKVLGPIGWLWAVRRGVMPSRTFPLILANDLVWWWPFALYLLRDRKRAGIAIAAAHLAACLLLLSVAGGTEIEPELTKRALFVETHQFRWTATWLSWMVTSLSIGPFFLLWAREQERHGLVTLACAICILGIPFDLAGEWVNLSTSAATFARDTHRYSLCGPGIANGLYCMGGLVMSARSWRSGFLRGTLGVVGFTMWTTGLALTIAALCSARIATVITGGLTMTLFVPWAALVSLRFSDR